MTLPASKGVNHKWHYTNNADFASKGGKKRKSKVCKASNQSVKRMQSAPNALSKSAKISIPNVNSLKSFTDCLPGSPPSPFNVPTSPATQYSPQFYGMQQETPPFVNNYFPLNFEDVLDPTYTLAEASSFNMLSPLSGMESDSALGGLKSPVMGTPPMCEFPELPELDLNDLIATSLPLPLTDTLLPDSNLYLQQDNTLILKQENNLYLNELTLANNASPADFPPLVDFNMDANFAFNCAIPSPTLTF